ncbi:hypothetical protein AAMO2058_001480000 [Amorphochlora amoebiformis]
MGKSRRARRKMLQEATTKKTSSYAAQLLSGLKDDKKRGKKKKPSTATAMAKALGLSTTTKKAKRVEKRKEFQEKLKAAARGNIAQIDYKLNKMGELRSSINTIVSESKNRHIKPAKKMSRKQKNRLLAAEVSNFCSIIEHPAFKQDPLSTINEHLTNTMAVKKEAEEGAKFLDEMEMAK